MTCNKLDNETLKSLYEEANEELTKFRPLLRSIYQHTMPMRDKYDNADVVVGEQTDLFIYNTAPAMYAEQFASHLASLIMPSGYRYFDIHSIDEVDNQDEFKIAVEPISDKILDHLNLSNCNQALNMACLDLNAGTGGYIINFDTELRQLYFTALNMDKVVFLEDRMGLVNYVFRALGTLNTSKQNRLYPNINFQGKTEVDVLECVYPVKNGFLYIITDKEFSIIFHEEFTKTNPFVIFRYGTRSGENRGRGILTNMIGNIIMTNTMYRDMLDATALVINPPIITDDISLLNPNNIKIQPNSIVTVKADAVLKPFPTSPNLPFAFQNIEENNKIIAKAFWVDVLGTAGGSTPMTATEVTSRIELMNTNLGEVYGRLKRELLVPTFLRAISLLEDNGELDIPVMNVRVGGNQDGTPKTKTRKLKLTFASPILSANDTVEVQKLAQAIQTTLQLTGDPHYISAGFNLPALPRYLTKMLGARTSLSNSEEDVTKQLQQAVQAKQAQQQAQMPQSSSNPSLQAPVNAGVLPSA